MLSNSKCNLKNNEDLDLDNYPLVSIIIPTYNEEKTIEEKIKDILRQDYEKDKMEIIVVDSASNDNTVNIAKKLNVKVFQQSERRGKANALNYALKNVNGDIVIITDADSSWETLDTIKKAVIYLKKFGGVTCIKKVRNNSIESTYRDLYNVLRLGESCIYSTPIAHGEFLAFRRGLIESFNEEIGADDSSSSHEISLKGERFVAVNDIICSELVPKEGYIHWRIRRAKHLIQHFSRAIRDINKVKDKGYKKILIIEYYIHLINPWLLIIALSLDLISSFLGNIISLFLIFAFFISLLSSQIRTWVIMQFLLAISQIKNFFNKEIVWKKEKK